MPGALKVALWAQSVLSASVISEVARERDHFWREIILL